MTLRIAVVLALVGAVLGLAAWRARRRTAYAPDLARLPDDAFAGPRAPLTVFYFTSRLCLACQETPAVVRAADPTIPLIPLSVHERPDLAHALGVFETPTLLLADAEGRIRYARVGNPDPSELRLWILEAGLQGERASSGG